MKTGKAVAGFAMLIICFGYTSALPAVAFDVLYPIKHPIKFGKKLAYPVQHPLKTGQWMESSGFNGAASGVGSMAALTFTISNFMLR